MDDPTNMEPSDAATDADAMLDSFIRMRDGVASEYEDISEQLDSMKAAQKTSTATFKQLMARKLTLASFLDTYRKYDLL